MRRNRLTEHTGAEFPIICGAMYPCSNPELVAAAANGEDDIDWTTKLTGIPVSVIKTPGHSRENNWLIRKLLSGRFKHRTRWLLNSISFRRWSKMAKNTRSTDIWSAGKSVETIRSVESATTVMRSLGESVETHDAG